MRILLSLTALLLSVVLLQLSSGGVGPLDALSGFELNFTTAQIGALGSAHFVGFFIGCWWSPRLLGTVGHSRAFAAFAATGAIGLLAHMLIINPTAWALMRVATGLSIAGCYTIIEAWLQAKVTNQTRGRTMGAYRAVDMGASLASQLMISVLTPASYVSYNILALLCCATLIPLALTKSQPPETPSAPRLRPMLAIQKSPLAATGVVVAALSGASFRMVGPIYGKEVGLEIGQIAYFLAAFILGGALAQFPVGWLADKFDRRKVMIWLSVSAIISCLITIIIGGESTMVIFLTALFFGLTTFPIFSVATAHAHDFAEPNERVELSAALMFFYALGAISAPLLASNLIEHYGPPALFVMIALAHLLLIAFGLNRMLARPTRPDRTSYIYAPRTSFIIGRLLTRKRDKS
ncbi:MAG: MFS transporter [Paracoccaceae bacterium]|nr:MFS transporter [Paracoccaceae bacterium]